MVRVAIFGAIVFWAFVTAVLTNIADMAIRPSLPSPVVAAVQARYPGAIIVRADLEKQASAVYRLRVRAPAGRGPTASLDAWVTPAGGLVRAERSAVRREPKMALSGHTSLRVE